MLLEIKEEGDVGEEEEKLSKIIKNNDIVFSNAKKF